MKLQSIKLIAILVLFMGWFSCTNDNDPSGFQWDDSEQQDNLPYRFQWDDSEQQEEYRPVKPGGESSSFKIDDNIISFAVPYLIGTKVIEYTQHHNLSILLIMAEGTDVTSLTPIITLAPGTTITLIEDRNEHVPANQVDYTGITEVGEYNFRHQIDITVIVPDGSIVTYMCLAVAIGDVLPCLEIVNGDD